VKRFALILGMALLSGSSVFAASQAFVEGEKLFLENKPKEAAVLLEQAVKEKLPEEKAFLYLGMAYLQMERFDDSIATLRNGLQSASAYTYLFYYDMANAFFLQRKYSFAEEMFGAAIEANPSYPGARLNRANTRMALRNYPGAVADYRSYLELEPDTPQREKIERIIGMIQTAMDEETRRTAQLEAKKLEEDKRRQELLDEVANSLKKAADETQSLSAGSEKVQGYDDEFMLAE
jgi:tetratricopeptide (TPR) repeat protein